MPKCRSSIPTPLCSVVLVVVVLVYGVVFVVDVYQLIRLELVVTTTLLLLLLLLMVPQR